MAAGRDVAGLVAGEGVPADHQAVGEESEGDGAFDRAWGAVFGVADAGVVDALISVPLAAARSMAAMTRWRRRAESA
ncbi:hypothetical protein [Saccharopolyspora pogona]|uniref:hypothetical protein n=1 Tax=Saccharopolyspora pogona TaxID=333966 RepID=UPI0016833112|nr:hypothetical protein [Saccharopolyspora pogona]